jgi:hypothetical protein
MATLALVMTGCRDDSGVAGGASELPRAPGRVAEGCRQAADVATFAVFCPTGWPEGSRPSASKLRLLGSDEAYLLEDGAGFGGRSPVFHVLLGGQRKPFPPGFEGGGKQLRVTTRRVLTPHYAGPGKGRILGHSVVERPTRRIAWTRVHRRPAAIMQAPPYPQGGIHGGHAIVMWNENGHGYLVSAHNERSHRAATAAALRIARSTQPLPERAPLEGG